MMTSDDYRQMRMGQAQILATLEATAHQPANGGAVPPGASIPRVPNVGRNSPCPCGSGKKFKTCHRIAP